MRFGTTLLLLLLVAGLGTVLWLTSEKPPAKVSASLHALDERSLLQCARMRWQFIDQPAVELARTGDGMFQVTEPFVDRVSRGYLQQIVSAWDSANLMATEYKDDEAARHETGLAPPQLQFSVEWPDGHRIAYDIGVAGPLGSDRFLRREGKIWRGGTGLYESMRVGFDDLRDRQVFLNQESTCRDLRVEYPAPTGKREVLQLHRGERGWRMVSPYEGRAEPVAAVQFVTALLSLRADSFLAGMVRPLSREHDVVVVVQGSLGEETMNLWVEQGAAFGQLPGRTGWFQCDPRTFEGVFEVAANRLRAKTLVGLANVAEELAEIVIDPGQGRGDRIHLVRDSVGTEWRLVEPILFATHPTPANELIQAINNLEAREFVDGKQASDPELGLGTERLTLSLRSFAQREAMAIWLGAAVVKNGQALAYACRADEPSTVVCVPGPALDHMKRVWTSYCALDIVRLPVQVERIELLPRTGAASRIYGNDAGQWREEGKEGNRDDVGDFVNDRLRDLIGKSAVDQRGNRLGEPDWTLVFSRGNKDVLTKLRLWDRGGELPVLAQRYDQADVAFDVGASVSKLLRELWQ